CVAYPKAKVYFPSGVTKLTGVPARKEVTNKSREESRRELGIENETLFVLALGGSQGALGINRNLPESVKLISTDRPDLHVRVLHQFGAGKENTVTVLKDPLSENIYKLVPFIEDVPTRLAASDIVITRAGASTLSEIACRGIPSIIIPFPHSAENHQVENAKSWESAGAAFCIEEKDLTPATLATAMLLLLSDPKKRESMSREAVKFGDPEAANRIAGLIGSLISN
ncbi:MAG: glycosyltransferase, partial [bacterium]